MCIISVIDAKENILDGKDIKTLTLTNCLLGNTDGFGYYLFNGKFSKTKDDALIYWRGNYDKFLDENHPNYNGIYHVRKASTNYYSKDNKHIVDEKSHPFIYNDIVVAHNGFFNFRYTHIDSEKYEKFVMGDLIDSQKFSIVLSKICSKGTVTFDNIKDSLNLFSGAYALAIKGIQDNFIWLVRGKDRTLYDMTIYDGENLVGKIVNTSTFSQTILGENLLDLGYDYDIKELKENTAYKYNLESYILEEVGEIKQDSAFSAKPVVTTYVSKSYEKSPKLVYTDILELMHSMGLIISDLVIMSEIIFGKPLFILSEEEFNTFSNILNKLNSETMHHSRISLWNEIIKIRKESIYKLYNRKGIQFPYFLNTKGELKELYYNIKKERKNDELFAVQ